MKTVTDFPAFAETACLLSDLSNERDQLEIEQAGLLKQLAFNTNHQPESLSTEQAARRLADGGDLPATAGDQMRKAAERELVVRTRLEAINKVLRDLPQLLEYRRQQARAAALQEMAGDVDKIKADFEKARTAMLAAMLAENALIDRLIVGGFGGGDAVLTAPHYLNRHRMIEVAANV
jgi:hypothetical protein